MKFTILALVATVAAKETPCKSNADCAKEENDKNPDAKVEVPTKDITKEDFEKNKAALQKLFKEKRGGECKSKCDEEADEGGLRKEACMADGDSLDAKAGDDAKCDALKDASDDTKCDA